MGRTPGRDAVSERIEITEAQARWLLEGIHIAMNEGWPSIKPQPSPADQDAISLRLAAIAGMDKSELWWITSGEANPPSLR